MNIPTHCDFWYFKNKKNPFGLVRVPLAFPMNKEFYSSLQFAVASLIKMVTFWWKEAQWPMWNLFGNWTNLCETSHHTHLTRESNEHDDDDFVFHRNCSFCKAKNKATTNYGNKFCLMVFQWNGLKSILILCFLQVWRGDVESRKVSAWKGCLVDFR